MTDKELAAEYRRAVKSLDGPHTMWQADKIQMYINSLLQEMARRFLERAEQTE